MVELDISKKPIVPFLACGLISGLAIAAPGCDALGGLAEECGLVCPDTGVAEGNASISGIVSVDAFFSAVVDVRAATLRVSNTIRVELEGIAASLGLEGYAELSLDELGAAVETGLQAQFSAFVEGGLTISYEPPRCELDVEASVQAAAECDVDVDPGSVEVQCMGSCEVSAEVAAECEAMGTLECTGTAPNFQCEGTCQGDCQLSASAGCSGECSGRCDGECSACVGGNCDVDGNGVTTNCAGSCSGGCEGTCQLEAGGSCEGRCEGSCTYTPPSGGCEANATARCDVSAMANAECQGKCEGDIQPPEVKAECEASVEAKASANLECTPPSLSIQFAFAAGVDADGQAEFKAWLEGFRGRFAAMAAASAQLEGIQIAAEGLISAAGGAVGDAFAELDADGGLNLKAAIGIGCALDELPAVTGELNAAVGDITGSITAFGRVAGSVGG